jgi:thiamine pyrophosphate-dependent acetolactate synthase large subunit-like protein
LISVDVGNNTYSFGRYFESKDQRVILSGYLGSIGFSFPAAMGAYMAAAGRPVLSISGDGGFGQYMGEFTTAVKYGMNITHILLNNGELGKISKEQQSEGWKVWQTSLTNPNFAEYARLCGGFGVRADSSRSLREGLQKALAYEGTALVEIISDPQLI